MRDVPVIVDRGWLLENMDEPEVVLADVRWYLDGRSGRAAYEAGHLPGAVFVDLDRDLSSPDKGGSAGRHPLPSTSAFAAALGRLGIGDEHSVVAYDDSGGGSAARLVWMLRTLGHGAALLDGGLNTWPGPLEQGASRNRAATELTVPHGWPATRLSTAEELVGPGAVVLDARAAERYGGEVEPIDARPGHVPGALNAPWTVNLGADGCFRERSDLAAHYRALGVASGGDVIAYCGSGVSACVDLVAIEHAGLGAGRLFVPSWSGWSADPDRPAALGPDPG